MCLIEAQSYGLPIISFNYKNGPKEMIKDGKITFLHKVKNGSVDKSYGINVARLANLPKEVTDRAEEILKVYEKKEKDRDIVIQTTLPLDFHENKNEIEDYIKNLNVLELTPIQAINTLYELKNKIKPN